MWASYEDIRSRISEPPKWYIHGVPRYGAFCPEAATVYALEVALVRTACQACGHEFDVAIENPGHQYGLDGTEMLSFLASFDIGDPPNIDGCVGATMTSEELELLEFWKRDRDLKWHRLSELEGPLSDHPESGLRRRSAMDYAQSAGVTDPYFDHIDQGNEAALARLLARADHEQSQIAARAAIKYREVQRRRPLPDWP